MAAPTPESCAQEVDKSNAAYQTFAKQIGKLDSTYAKMNGEYRLMADALWQGSDVIKELQKKITDTQKELADSIVTGDADAARRFAREVDSATVYVNASTRFTDGFEFGFGAETGISTNRLHARGPMGLNELTTYKYVIAGNGQVRA